jgi:hypothetical protein
MKQKMILGLGLLLIIMGILTYYFLSHTQPQGIIEEDLPPSNKF